jgi:hypothetical protein
VSKQISVTRQFHAPGSRVAPKALEVCRVGSDASAGHARTSVGGAGESMNGEDDEDERDKGEPGDD